MRTASRRRAMHRGQCSTVSQGALSEMLNPQRGQTAQARGPLFKRSSLCRRCDRTRSRRRRGWSGRAPLRHGHQPQCRHQPEGRSVALPLAAVRPTPTATSPLELLGDRVVGDEVFDLDEASAFLEHRVDGVLHSTGCEHGALLIYAAGLLLPNADAAASVTRGRRNRQVHLSQIPTLERRGPHPSRAKP